MAAAAFPKVGVSKSAYPHACACSHSKAATPPPAPARADGHSHVSFGAEAKPVEAKQPACSFCMNNVRWREAYIARLRRNGQRVSVRLLNELERVARYAHTHSRPRDDDRNIVCETLLNTKCTQCGEEGHTRSRCAECEYCGVRGHTQLECPKELADQKAKGKTVILRGVSDEMLQYIKNLLEGRAVFPTETKDGLWEAECGDESYYYGFEAPEGDDVYDVIEKMPKELMEPVDDKVTDAEKVSYLTAATKSIHDLPGSVEADE